MKVFCDTNVLVAAFITNHPQHNAARPVLERIKARSDQGWAATHSLAESYAVLTRLPAQAKRLRVWHGNSFPKTSSRIFLSLLYLRRSIQKPWRTPPRAEFRAEKHMTPFSWRPPLKAA